MICQIHLKEVGSLQELMECLEQQKAGRDISRKEPSLLKILEHIENELEALLAENTFKLDLVKHFRSEIRKRYEKEEQENRPDQSEKSKKSKPEEPKKSPVKIDGDEKPSSDDTANRRLEILKEGAKDVIKALKKSPMAKRFKFLKRLKRGLVAATKPGAEETEIQRIVQFESAIAEALTTLHGSKMAARSNLLKKIKSDLEETMDKSRQV
jgi:hypothetical protein